MATQSAGHEHPQQQSEELVAHGATEAVVGTTNAQTLTNKTLTAPVVNTSLTGTAVGTGASQVAAGNHTHINTGSYTGDGATSQAITGVGFTPKYVRIWDRQTADNQVITTFETTTDIVDDNASGMAIVHTSTSFTSDTDAIISLDADGFTVDDKGLDVHPNKNGTVYNYLALG